MKILLESCFALTTKLLKEDLRKARDKELVEGYLNILDNGRVSVLDYRVEYEEEATYLEIFFGVEPQRILLSEQELTFGIRTYLTCGCGFRVNALYLKGTYFACRKCQNLRYQSTTINSKSEHGIFLYRQSQRLKLMNMREDMPRIFYKSEYTKRFTRWLNLCNRAGLENEVRSARELIGAIHNQNQ